MRDLGFTVEISFDGLGRDTSSRNITSVVEADRAQWDAMLQPYFDVSAQSAISLLIRAFLILTKDPGPRNLGRSDYIDLSSDEEWRMMEGYEYLFDDKDEAQYQCNYNSYLYPYPFEYEDDDGDDELEEEDEEDEIEEDEGLGEEV
jgi:hypothetical protein